MTGWEIIAPFLEPIGPWLSDPTVSEICVNGPSRIFVERAGCMERVEASFCSPRDPEGDRSLAAAAKSIARRLGSDISDANPLLYSRLPDGSRIAIVAPPVAVGGLCMTIRKFQYEDLTLERLVERGTLSRVLADVLVQELVERRHNLMISGGTGSGKTTLLNALVRKIPESDRIVVIEDTAELRLVQPNVVRFEARPAMGNLPEISIRQLLRATLRHRPDRIILGEVRGGEAFDLLQLMNTGHQGSASSIHADDVSQTLHRFADCVLMAETDLPFVPVCRSIAAALHCVVHLARRGGQRVVTEACRIVSYDVETGQFDALPLVG